MHAPAAPLLLLTLHAVGCDDVRPGDDEGGARTTGAPSSDAATDAGSDTDSDAMPTTTDGEGSTSDGDPDGTTTGEPQGHCEPACADGELCFEADCYSTGFSMAIGGGTDRQTIYAVDHDSAGNIIVAGDFANNLEIGDDVYASLGSGRDMFVAKFNPIGEPLWVRTFGSAEVVHQAAKALAVAPDDTIVLGGEIQDEVDFGLGPVASQGVTDIFLATLDTDGNTLWATAWGDAEHQHLEALAVADDGSISFTGDFNGTFDVGGDPLVNAGGGPDVFVAKLDADGGHQWSLHTGTDNNQHGRALALDAAGNVHVCGEFRGTLDFGGGELASSVSDVFVAKLAAADGAQQWAMSNFDDGEDACHAVDVDADGNVAIHGRFHDTLSFGDADAGLEGSSASNGEDFVAYFDADGALQWSRGFGAGSNDTGTDPLNLTFDAGGNVIVSGAIHVPIDFGGGVLEPGQTSVYVAKLGPTGDHVSSQLYGDDNRHVATAVTVDVADNIVVVGEFTGTIDFGFGMHSTTANPDAFVARFLP